MFSSRAFLASAQVLTALLLTPVMAQRNLSGLLDSNQVEQARELSRVNSSAAFCGPEFENHDPITSYAGHFTVDENKVNHLFFWFFPADDVSDPVKPLLVWLNGGPGLSSMTSLLQSHGPVEVNLEAQGEDCLLKPRMNGSWVGAFSVLYIDNPVGTGFSYSDNGTDGFITNKNSYTDGLYSALKQFLKLFPTYQNHPLYLGGLAYGAKYVALLASRVDGNRATHNMSLSGLIFGSPFFSPWIMNNYKAKLAFAMGFIGEGESETFTRCSNEFFRNISSSEYRKLSDEKKMEALEKAFSLDIDERLKHNFVTRPTNVTAKRIEKAMSTPSIKTALGNNGLRFDGFADDVYRKLVDDIPRGVKEELGNLLDNHKVLIYNGLYDVNINSVMIDETLQRTNWTYQEDFIKTKRLAWYVNGTDVLRGFYSRLDNLCRVVVHGAGRYASVDQPEVHLSMVQDFVQHGCIQ